MNQVLNIEDLTKKIDRFTLGPMNITIEPGTITALVGNNGSGKSTLLKIIMNLVKPTTGDVVLFDQEVNGEGEDWKNRVAYQPQTAIGYDLFTGEELKTLIAHWYPSWDETLFNRIVDSLDVDLHKRFDKLSQGSRQKLVIALTLSRSADLLILDEPTSFMDIPSKESLINLLVEWMDQGERAILIASHQAEDIRKLADDIVILRNGKMLGTYTKEELTESYMRYWIKDTSLASEIPGLVKVEETSIISNNPEATEKYLEENAIDLLNRTSMELDEIMTTILKRKDHEK